MIGIYNLSDLHKQNIRKDNGVRGVYIWGMTVEKKHIPLYVGRNRNIHERILQHLARWRGGEYRVPKLKDILAQNSSEKPFIHNPKLPYIPHGPVGYKTFLGCKNIQDTINSVLDNFFCCWDEIPKTIKLKEVEDALATLIRKEGLISKHRVNSTLPTPHTSALYDAFVKAGGVNSFK